MKKQFAVVTLLVVLLSGCSGKTYGKADSKIDGKTEGKTEELTEEQNRAQEKAIAEIKKLGGRVTTVRNPEIIDLGSTKVTDAS